jgi:NitT/TauT family transport system substrate-binding protein
MSKEKMSLDDLLAILTAPDYIFDRTPRRIGSALKMLNKTGTIKTKAQSWKEMYFPEAQQLAGD